MFYFYHSGGLTTMPFEHRSFMRDATELVVSMIHRHFTSFVVPSKAAIQAKADEVV